MSFSCERESTTVVPMFFEFDDVPTVPEAGVVQVLVTAPTGERPSRALPGWADPVFTDDGRVGPLIGPGTSYDFSQLDPTKYPYDRRVWSKIVGAPDTDVTDHGLIRIR